MTVQFKNAPGGADFLSRRKRERKNIGSNQLLAQKVYTKSSRSSSAVKSSAMVIITHTHTHARALFLLLTRTHREHRENICWGLCVKVVIFLEETRKISFEMQKRALRRAKIFSYGTI